MLIFWGFTIAGFIFLDRLHKFNRETRELDAQFHFYRLRDNLREAAIKKQVNPKSWLFNFLDRSIAKAIDNVDTISLFNILIWGIFPYNDEEICAARKQLEEELKNPKNRVLADYYGEYIGTIAGALWSRHAVLRFTTTKILELSKLDIRRISIFYYVKSEVVKVRTAWKNILGNQMENPLVSSLRECH